MSPETDNTVGMLKGVLMDALAPILLKNRKVALLDFPAYSNVGDSAIWLGELSLLRSFRQKINYVCDTNTYSSRSLKGCIQDGIILLSGGGNLGDLWPKHQQFREHVIDAFKKYKIVQMPQSIHFQGASALRQASKIFRAHKNLTIMVRDEASFEIASRHLSDDVRLCPDAAFAIDGLPLRDDPKQEILWLGRNDIESTARREHVHAGFVRYDWPSNVPSPWIRLGEYVRRQRGLRPRTEPISRLLLRRLYEPMARARFVAGCRLLGRGRVVVTDRLHGHILCLLLGIVHVVLDNSYAKVSGFHEKWTKCSSLTHSASTLEEAKQIAYYLLGDKAMNCSGIIGDYES